MTDLANTLINWLEYTQLAKREDGKVEVLDDKREEVKRSDFKPVSHLYSSPKRKRRGKLIFQYLIGQHIYRRIKIRPFRFLLKLLDDSKVGYLTEEEIAKIVVTEAENESDKCYKHLPENLHS